MNDHIEVGETARRQVSKVEPPKQIPECVQPRGKNQGMACTSHGSHDLMVVVPRVPSAMAFAVNATETQRT